MQPAFLIVLAVVILLGASLLVLGLWRHKNASGGDVKLLGERGRVETRIDPEGSVIVAGELWRARSHDGRAIDVGSVVRVVGMHSHLAVVELSEPPA